MMATPIGAPNTVSSVPGAVLEFYSAERTRDITALVAAYSKQYPEMSPNRTKLSAHAIRLFFAGADHADALPLYVPHGGWFVYNEY